MKYACLTFLLLLAACVPEIPEPEPDFPLCYQFNSRFPDNTTLKVCDFQTYGGPYPAPVEFVKHFVTMGEHRGWRKAVIWDDGRGNEFCYCASHTDLYGPEGSSGGCSLIVLKGGLTSELESQNCESEVNYCGYFSAIDVFKRCVE